MTVASDTAAKYLRESAVSLIARRNASPIEPVERASDTYAAGIEALRKEGLIGSLPAETVERIFALGFALEQLRQNSRDLQRCVSESARMSIMARGSAG